MKGKFDAYVMWPLDKRVQSWIVHRSTTYLQLYGFIFPTFSTSWSILHSQPASPTNLAKTNRNVKTNALYQSALKVNILHSYFAVSSEALPATEEGDLVKSLVLSSVQVKPLYRIVFYWVTLEQDLVLAL